ncbi:MAG: BrnA antitoxin family protein [Boseongicola sp.]|nr:BrnA antitoxin family protein [Boseongicola sp.]NNJ69206.1 hypothetical protein [Boseongicola sp.]
MPPPVIWTSKRTGTKTRRLAEARFHQLLYYASNESNDFLEEARREVPDAWLTLELDMETVAPKKKVSLYLDEAVVKMYRAMGPGYQGRINRILETWMQMKIAEKTEMYRDLLDQLEADGAARLEGREPEDVMAGGKTLAESWAYNEGLRDGLTVLGHAPQGKTPGGHSPDASTSD